MAPHSAHSAHLTVPPHHLASTARGIIVKLLHHASVTIGISERRVHVSSADPRGTALSRLEALACRYIGRWSHRGTPATLSEGPAGGHCHPSPTRLAPSPRPSFAPPSGSPFPKEDLSAASASNSHALKLHQNACRVALRSSLFQRPTRNRLGTTRRPDRPSALFHPPLCHCQPTTHRPRQSVGECDLLSLRRRRSRDSLRRLVDASTRTPPTASLRRGPRSEPWSIAPSPLRFPGINLILDLPRLKKGRARAGQPPGTPARLNWADRR